MARYKISFVVLVTVLTSVYGQKVKYENPCSIFAVPCDNGQCISADYWCDDQVDCVDTSDEMYCGKKDSKKCTNMHFKCGDGKCLPIFLRCNGWSECNDKSDEQNCDDSDELTFSSTTETHTSPTTTTSTTTTEMYHTTSTSNYYQSRREEGNRRYGYQQPYTSASSATTYPYVSLPPTIEPFDNHWNNQGGYRPGSVDTHPRRNFPDNQHPTPRTEIHGYPPTSHHIPTATGTRQRPPSYPYDRRVIQPARSILHPPRLTPLSSSRRNLRRPKFSIFYFTKNYTHEVAYRYKDNIQDAKRWLVGQRDKSYNWGRDTPRALIALSLIHNSFTSDVEDNELMKKGLQTHLGIKLLRNSTNVEKMTTTRLAVYINALLATCQNPFDFLGVDLVEDLYQRHHLRERRQQFVNPLIYLTLCLTDKYVHVDYLRTFLKNSFPDEITKDLHILATAAMACLAQKDPGNDYIRTTLDDAVHNLLSQMNQTEGSFGSKYSTALAAQVLMSVNTSEYWDSRKTFDYLADQQVPDGSFGDMQSTYYTLIALSGRSLVYLRNTHCDPDDVKTERTPDDILNAPDPKISILYTLRVGYPETFSAAMQLSVPNNTNFYDIMRVAAYQDPRFKFKYEISKGNLYNVHTIANIPNDPERGMFWTLYHVNATDRLDFNKRYLKNIIDLRPNHGDELIYWYLSDF